MESMIEVLDQKMQVNNKSSNDDHYVVGENGQLSLSSQAIDCRVALDQQLVRGVPEATVKELIKQVYLESQKRMKPINVSESDIEVNFNEDQKKQMIKNKTGYHLLTDLFIIMFKCRDIDEGKGERLISYVGFLELYQYFPETLKSCLHLLPDKFGSWLDINNLLVLVYNKINHKNVFEIADDYQKKVFSYHSLYNFLIEMYVNQLKKDIESDSPSLAGKWVFRESRKTPMKYMARDIALKMFGDELVVLKVDQSLPSFNECLKNKNLEPGNPICIKNMELARASCYAKYRRAIAKINTSVEKIMCDPNGNWSEIKPGEVPALCLKKHRKGFLNQTLKNNLVPRSDKEDRIQCAKNFQEYLNGCLKDPKNHRVHGKNLMPHQLVSYYLRGGQFDNVIEAQWIDLVENLKESGSFNNMLAVVDISGSMNGLPMEVAIAMGLLIVAVSKICQGRFISFHEQPNWHQITGTTLEQQVQEAQNCPWGGSTNFEASMNLVLEATVEGNLSPDEVKNLKLVILSDMEFDCANGTGYYGWVNSYPNQNSPAKWSIAYDNLKIGFSEAGNKSNFKEPFEVPEIWFWNLRSSTISFPVKDDIPGAFLISGWSQNTLKTMMKGEDLKSIKPPTSYELLRMELDSERYEPIRNKIKEQEESFFGYLIANENEEEHNDENNQENNDIGDDDGPILESSQIEDINKEKNIHSFEEFPNCLKLDYEDISEGWIDIIEGEYPQETIKKIEMELEKLKKK